MRLRPPHGQRERLRARGVGGDRPRHRALPPRLQPLERHRLQLPRRPVRPGVRGPCGRDRPGRDRRAGPGLQLRVDRDRHHRDVQLRAVSRAGDGRARAPDRVEAGAARRADAGHGHRDLARRLGQPLPERRAGDPRAHLRPSRRRLDLLPRRVALRPAARPARPGRALRGPARRDHGARRQPAHPLAAGRSSRASCASPTAPRRPARRSRSSSRSPARRSRASPTRSAAPTAHGRRACRWRRAARFAQHSRATARARRSPPPRSRSASSRCCGWASPPAGCASGRAIAVSGTVSPKPATGRVEVRVERRIGRRWARVQRKRINVRGGRFLTRIRMRRAGLYRISVLVPGATQRRLLRVR